MKLFNTLTLITAAATLTLSSCKKDDKEPTVEETPAAGPSYTIPTTYDFGTNTNFKTSAQRVNMAKELITYLRSTHTATAQVTILSSKMNEMYANSNSQFADAALNTSGINLRDKVSTSFSLNNELISYFNEAATVSSSTASASNGTAGKLLGPAPTTSAGVQSAWLVDAKGFEYKELVEKGIMGGLFYSEAMKILNKIENFDNATVVAGEGTAMEHAWDEAFGYFGVPVTFPTTTTSLSYWGSYCNSVNAAIGSNATIMNAWLKGRAAISNKDADGRDEAKKIVVATWEKIAAARFITYMKQAKTNIAVDGPRNHALSEGIGFIRAFRYNSAKTISDVDIALLASYIGDNLYNVSQSNIDLAINKVADIFKLDASKL